MYISKRYILTVCTLILISSVITLTILLHNSFEKIQSARIFPFGFDPQIQQRAKSTIDFEKSILLIGDSRILMWPNRLIDGFHQINIGHGGQTSTQTYLQLTHLDLPKTKFAFVQVGINDIHSLNLFGASAKRVLSQLKKNLYMIKEILKNKGYVVIFSTIIPPSPTPISRILYVPDNILSIIHNINKFIYSLQETGVVIFDSFSLLKSSNNFLSKNYRDKDFFLHLNSDAYKYLSKSLSKILLQL